MKTDAISWLVEETLAVQTTIAKESDGTCASKPGKGAKEADVLAAEKKLGVKLPAEYREFLLVCDGWKQFDYGENLFSAKELAARSKSTLAETLSYLDKDDYAAEIARLKKCIVIGEGENDATLFCIDPTVKKGAVERWMYTAQETFDGFRAFLRGHFDDKTSEMNEHAKTRANATKTMEPGERKRRDAALEKALGERLRAAKSKTDVRPLPANAVKRAAATKPTDLVRNLKKSKKKPLARVGLGLTLYLGAYPTKDEVVRAVEAFHRLVPPLPHVLARTPDSFGLDHWDEIENPAKENWRARVRDVDAYGHFGLHVASFEHADPFERDDHGGNAQSILVRGVPMADGDQDENEDEDENEEGDGDGELVERASFCEIRLPLKVSPKTLYALAVELTDILPVRSGHGGYVGLDFNDDDDNEDAFDVFYEWSHRYFGLDLSRVDEFLIETLHSVRGAQWITVLGAPFVRSLEAVRGKKALAFGKDIAVDRRKNASVVIRAGNGPTLGDLARGEFPTAYAEVDAAIDPFRVKDPENETILWLGGVAFLATSVDFPGAFAEHGATRNWLRRFVRPDVYLGRSARDLVKELAKAANAGKVAKVDERLAELEARGDRYHGMGLDLYNATMKLQKNKKALRSVANIHEAAVRTGSFPNEVWIGLTYAYLNLPDWKAGLGAVERALKAGEPTAGLHYNAACIYARSGKEKEALEQIRQTFAAGWKDVKQVYRDDDLVSLRGKPAFEKIFADLKQSKTKSKKAR